MLNVDAFEKLDKVIHEPSRMAIVSLLASSEVLAFRELREGLRLTDGNLSVHMRTLEEHGYVSVNKSFVNRKPRTEYALTPRGRDAFAAYLETLEEIVRQSQPVERPVREAPPLLRPGMAGAK